MHPEIIEWVNEARRLARPGARVVEVGSGDMNGTVRQLFPASDYVGVDLRIGAGMEILGDARALPLQSDSCDLVLCLSVLEHVRCWRRIVLEIGRVLRLKGVAIITAAATGYPEHAGGTDYYGAIPPWRLAALFQLHWRRWSLTAEPNSLGFPDVKAWAIK